MKKKSYINGNVEVSQESVDFLNNYIFTTNKCLKEHNLSIAVLCIFGFCVLKEINNIKKELKK